MKNMQRSKADSYDRIGNFNTTHSVEIAAIPDYAAEQAVFNADWAKISLAAVSQTADTSGYANDSDAAKVAMADITVKFGLRGAVKARRAGNNALAEQLAHYKTYIYFAPKQEAIQRAIDIRNALSINLTICTNVTAADITAIDAAVADYQSVQSQPVTARQTKKATGTSVLPQLFKTADEAIDNMYDLLFSYYQDTNPALVNEFRLAMQIISTGVHHTGIHAEITAGNPVKAMEGITMKIVELNKTAVSDINGMAQIERIKPGTYHIEFSGADIITKTLVITITRGQISEVDVLVQKVA